MEQQILGNHPLGGSVRRAHSEILKHFQTKILSNKKKENSREYLHFFEYIRWLGKFDQRLFIQKFICRLS